MNLNNLKEKLQEILELITESQVYTHFYEKYQELSSRTQKLVKLLSVLTLLFFISLIPYASLQSSLESQDDFNENVGLIKDLNEIKAHKSISQKPSLVPKYFTLASLEKKIQEEAEAFTLLEQQIEFIKEISSPSESVYSKFNLKEERLQASFLKLNFTQLVQIGSYIENLSPSVKVSNLLIKKNLEEKKEYFNVTYEISLLSPLKK